MHVGAVLRSGGTAFWRGGTALRPGGTALRSGIGIFQLGVLASAVLIAPGCQPRADPYATPEQAVRTHIRAAATGNVTVLRRDACGELAAAMAERSDDEIRDRFRHLYDVGPDEFSVRRDPADQEPAGEPTQRYRVDGFYPRATDLQIAFVVEGRDGRYRVCEIRRSNDPFGPLPPPLG